MIIERLNRRHALARIALCGVVAVGAVLVGPIAQAAVRGRYRTTRREIEEHDSAWRVLMNIQLDAPPPSARLNIRFVFEQQVDFERVEGDGGTGERRRPVQPPKNVALEKEVDFSAVGGGIGRSGRAELELTRDRGFRAGEWTLELHGPDGSIGPKVPLTLKGTNPPG